jgi:hypothetical protein
MLLKFVLAHDADMPKAAGFFIKMTYERRLLKLDSVTDQILANWHDEFNLLDFTKVETT